MGNGALPNGSSYSAHPRLYRLGGQQVQSHVSYWGHCGKDVLVASFSHFDRAARLAAILAGESPANRRSPVTVVVISSDGEGDRSVESLEVKVPEGWGADSDEAGHAFQSEAGHLFRSEAGRGSDLMSATLRRAAAGRWDDLFLWLLGQAVKRMVRACVVCACSRRRARF